ncbi:MAG: hypothetical protein NTY09_04225 [bacterium]|nr:hypothetical protein [bacterium]
MRRWCLVLAVISLMAVIGPGAAGQEPNPEGVTWAFNGLVAEGGSWEMRITTSQRTFNPGDGMTLAIDFDINSIGLAFNAQRINGIYTLVTGLRTFNADGDMIGASHTMASTILNGLGFPIEGETQGLPTDRFGGAFHHPIDSYAVTPSSDLQIDTTAGTIHGTVIHQISIAPDIPPGWYLLRIDIGLEIGPDDHVTLWGMNPSNQSITEDQQTYAVVGPVAIGTTSQPQITWSLFSNNLPGGGVIALEDTGYMAASRGLGYSSVPILPMTDSTGGQTRYLIEPDFPMVWNPFMRTSGTALDLDLHSGWMQARIENPDGAILDLGGASFNGRRGLGATTLLDKFAFSFSSYGRHRIELTGWIRDSSNQTYVGGGVYEVYVAQPLQIETNVLPGTPFSVDEYFDCGFQVFPPVPATVSVTWKLDTHSSGSIASDTFEAIANRWGYYSPPVLEGRDRFARATKVQFTTPGEYEVTFVASYTEPDGTLWKGEKIINGVVLPPSNVIQLASRPPSTGSFAITSDAQYIPVPADTANTMILPESASPGLPTVYTFPIGFFPGDQTGFRTDDSALQGIESVSTGIFVTPRLATASGLFPHTYPEDIDRRAYLINAATRQDGFCQIRTCEGSPSAHLPYPTFPWNPGELAADSPGDIYHFWSCMTYRDLTSESVRYGSYASGAVLTSDLASPVIYNPGDALISDGWGVHSLILHNLAIRPGSIVAKDQPFTPAAYFLPLPPESTVEFVITPPLGNQRTITVTAGPDGYASDMSQRFELDYPGIWTVSAKLTQEEFSGGILGVNSDTAWEFYVIENNNTIPITFHLPEREPLDPNSDIVVLTGDLTANDLAEGSVNISTTFNGTVIEQTSRDITAGLFTYSLDITQVANTYPNFDPYDPNDRLVITFYANGMTSAGLRLTAAKMIYIQNGVIYSGEKDYTPIDPQTRDERLRAIAESAESELAHENRGRVPDLVE